MWLLSEANPMRLNEGHPGLTRGILLATYILCVLSEPRAQIFHFGVLIHMSDILHVAGQRRFAHENILTKHGRVGMLLEQPVCLLGFVQGSFRPVHQCI